MSMKTKRTVGSFLELWKRLNMFLMKTDSLLPRGVQYTQLAINWRIQVCKQGILQCLALNQINEAPYPPEVWLISIHEKAVFKLMNFLLAS